MAPTELERVRARLGDRYQLERELGRGGMGTVYLARDLRLDRAVALKVLPMEYATDGPLRERFVRETRTAASFSHPNIVPVHAVEESDDCLAYAMGFVEGESLTERVRRAGPLGVRELVRLLQDVGYALAYAHGRGVVHRDLKPDNVSIARPVARSMLMDFGIARVIAGVAPESRPGLTRVGEVVGTPEYMSPEQATAEPLDGRSDLYSLGLVAHFAATGQTVMEAPTPRAVMVRQLSEMPPALGTVRPDLPSSLTTAIDRCVQKDAAARFQTAEALVEAIDAAQLAAPEIPLPVRGLVQELSTLLLVLAFVLVISVVLIRNAPTSMPFYIRMLPAVFFVAIGLGRVWQTLSMVRRMAEVGYTLDDIMHGLRRVMEEQDDVRREIRLDTRVRTRRRRAIRNAIIALPIGAAAFYLAVVQFAPPRPPDSVREEVAAVGQELSADSVRPTFARPSATAEKQGAVLTVISFMLVGVSLVSLTRSPFRMPAGEWVFRQVFLRAPGRGFLAIATRVADRSMVTDRSRTLTPVRAVTPQRMPSLRTVPSTLPKPSLTLESIDDRLRELERWRATRQP